MEGFTTHTGRMAVVGDDNIDTDRIIPARYLTRVSRSGYGELLFHDVRSPQFELDQAEAAGATVLVVGTNFGCGSSREHAVWAIQQAGFVAVMARRDPTSPGYSDIFRQNAANCGLLLGELAPEAHAQAVAAGTGSTVTVDLPNQRLDLAGSAVSFEINPVTKAALIEGLDLIGTTLREGEAIDAYEARMVEFVPTRS